MLTRLLAQVLTGSVGGIWVICSFVAVASPQALRQAALSMPTQSFRLLVSRIFPLHGKEHLMWCIDGLTFTIGPNNPVTAYTFMSMLAHASIVACYHNAHLCLEQAHQQNRSRNSAAHQDSRNMFSHGCSIDCTSASVFT